MAEKKLKGIGFVDGTKEGFDFEGLQDDHLYFVRTSSDKEYGVVYFNGKKYNTSKIDAGEYPDNTVSEAPE